MKFGLNKNNKFRWPGLVGYPYNSKDDFANASAAYFEVTGSHGKVRNKKSDRIYFVISGKGEFIVGNESYQVAGNDVVIVPKSTVYDYRATEGVLNLFLVHSPAYDSNAEERFDKK